MATIALYADKMNQMTGLISAAKLAVTDFKTELSSLKSKTLTINKGVCNIDDVISSIQASTQTQEKKIASLNALENNCRTFISEAVRIDREVADLINKRKDEFYNEYSYLKPECEKTWLEKAGDWFAPVGEWFKENWKVLTTVAIVIVAIAFICTGVGGILGAMALGALFGAGIGGVAGGVISTLSGGSFWEGAKEGAFMGAISGIIAGGMGFAMAAGGTAASLGLGQTMLIGGVSGAGSSLFGDVGDILIKGADISFEQVLINMGISGALGAAFAGIGYGLSKAFTALKGKFFKPSVETPYGKAMQSSSADAIKARQYVDNGGQLYRGGTFGRSNVTDAQFWATENPLNPGYANKYGVDFSRVDYVIGGKQIPGTPYITRPAPALGNNAGGGIEIVNNPNSVKIDFFYMP